MTDWKKFVLDYGWGVWAPELAAVLERSVEDVERIRSTGACSKRKLKTFSELFVLWHGRAPNDSEWPVPRKAGARGAYEWQAREDALLASLVGRIGVHEIAGVLTKRLRDLTQERKVCRSHAAVLVRIHKIGLQTNDLVGGITTAQAAREIGNITAINQAIARKSGQERLHAVRVGRYWMIPHAEWARWKSTRVFPPKGYVTLASLRERLGIRSDSKLPEFASRGYIPTAIRCNVFGTQVHTSQYGTWFVDAKVARKLLADRRAGRPMPWHGKPMPDNLKATFKLWQKRKHPSECETCARLWGERGVPAMFTDYSERYPELPLGAKLHLTKPWSPGLSLPDVARRCAVPYSRVLRAVHIGVLEHVRFRGNRYVTLTAATIWKAHRCPAGSHRFSWISVATARKQYLFTPSELRGFIDSGKLRSKVGTDGPMRGITYVLRHQCSLLRAKIGFSEEDAARRAGVSVARLRILLKGVDMIGAKGIPLQAIKVVIDRIESRVGHTLEQAAAKLQVGEDWVRDRVTDGTVRVTRANWDRRRVYITGPMLDRLRKAKRKPLVRERLGPGWILLGDAAVVAGVSITTMMRWAEAGDVQRQHTPVGWRYRRSSVCARARRYWKSCRFHRAARPDWLKPGRRASPAAAMVTS